MIWDNNADILLLHTDDTRRGVQEALDSSREERRPYVIITPNMVIRDLTRMVVPVSMLEEEVYKAEICTYLARKTGAEIILLQAHDYGSRARRHVERIIAHILSVMERTGETIHYQVVQGKKDSSNLMVEAARMAQQGMGELMVLTASREYGLDDWLFGPQERKAILRSAVPVMLVNPRADLFSLCD